MSVLEQYIDGEIHVPANIDNTKGNRETDELVVITAEYAVGVNDLSDHEPLVKQCIDMMMSDKNSSQLLEWVTAYLIGCVPLEGKHGRDCVDLNTGIEKEIKPKKYTETPTDGGAVFNDYTRKRWEKDKAVNLPIVQSYWVNGRVQYIVEFPFSAIADRLEEQIIRTCEERNNDYVRNAGWTYKHWINHCTVHYVSKTELQKNQGAFNKKLYMELMKRK